MKNKHYIDFSKETLDIGYHFMLIELAEYKAPTWLCELFKMAWQDFKAGIFSYDGATFVKERSDKTLFEVASFIHDWLNGKGYVSYEVDSLFIYIMKLLNYPKKQIFLRWFLTRFTFINIWRHKFYLKDYKGKFAIEVLIK